MKKLIAIALLATSLPVLASDAGGPVMRLFPTTVLEDIKETGKAAEKMENNL